MAPTRPLHAAQPALPYAHVLGYEIYAGDRLGLVGAILGAAQTTRAPFLVDYLNAAQFNRGEEDAEFRRRLRDMDLLYADGQSILWAARRQDARIEERLTAADFIGDFFQRAGAAGVSVSLVGGAPGAAAAFASYWRSEAPGLEIRTIRHGFFSGAEEPEVMREIAAARADVLLVGLGAPRQEAFVERAAASGELRVAWCVGALFEYGPWGRRRAPQWMRRAGLEWAFRLAQEPRRLAGRYLIGNPLFVWRVLAGRWG